MRPAEFWTLYHGKVNRLRRSAGKLTDEDAADLRAAMDKKQKQLNKDAAI